MMDVVEISTEVRRCPNCDAVVTGRRNKLFCSMNCRKRYSEPKQNAANSPRKRRANMELFARSRRLGEELYKVRPQDRLGFIQELIDEARNGDDSQLRDILSNYKLQYPHPFNDTHMFPKGSRSYCTIAQATRNYCKKFWRADVADVVYGRVSEPDTGECPKSVRPLIKRKAA